MDQSGFHFARSGWRLRHLAELQPQQAHKPGSRETASGLFVCALPRTSGSGRQRCRSSLTIWIAIPGSLLTAHGVVRSHFLRARGVRVAMRPGNADVARRSSTSLPATWCRFDSGRPHQSTAHARACVALWPAPVPVRRWPCLVSRRTVFDSQRGHQIRLCRSKDRMPCYERGDGRSIRPGGANAPLHLAP